MKLENVIDENVIERQINSSSPSCRFCNTKLEHTFIDLGMSPLCQTQIKPDELNKMEAFYPLHVYVCHECFLVQLEQFVAPDNIFSNEYPYFSSFSVSWVEHARQYVEMISQKLELNTDSFVGEIASNDGYLLQHFVNNKIPCLGIEPAANCAAEAEKKGVKSVTKFFGRDTAKEIAEEFGKVDLLLGNNVLAHVPDINDFVAGMKILLKESGVITMEFPHLLSLIRQNQFDTIYHEHFSYLSLATVLRIFSFHGLSVFDVDVIPTHGGSIRIYACHNEDKNHHVSERISELLAIEKAEGLDEIERYNQFEEKVKETKRKILEFLIREKGNGKQIVGYGAPGKGNTLLNYCGIRQDFLDYTVDMSPHKYGTYTPGTRIPIYHPDMLKETKPDYIFILPWNLKKEITEQHSYVREWGGRFVIPIPEIEII